MFTEVLESSSDVLTEDLVQVSRSHLFLHVPWGQSLDLSASGGLVTEVAEVGIDTKSLVPQVVGRTVWMSLVTYEGRDDGKRVY